MTKASAHSDVESAAAEWLIRLETKADSHVREECQRWLDANPLHDAAFARLRRTWDHANILRELRLEGEIDENIVENFQRTKNNRKPSEGIDSVVHESRDATSTPDADPTSSELQNKILLLPGTRLATIAEIILTRDSYKRYVKPILADMQDEYVELFAKGQVRRARWVVVRGYCVIRP
jgi:hypothetical protein